VSLPDKYGSATPSLHEILNEGSLTQAKETLFKIFAAVKRDFNGSLFGEELEGEIHSSTHMPKGSPHGETHHTIATQRSAIFHIFLPLTRSPR
jgi:hypothetical protein